MRTLILKCKDFFVNLNSLGARLRSARKGLGKSQDDMAAACGVSREMWGKYERDAAMPGGEVLMKVALAGIDMNYILTGQHAGSTAPQPASTLSRRARALVENYEATGEDGKKIIEAAAFAAAKPGITARKPKAA